ncbi:hypothetical protein DOTSEDRAFT_74811 [Dothistroma septosporum NZE10]|uniref:Methyltransferase domain-containing protein n=1 Tax=Dothistroma septosporum (strain NZE10 / CBS 128990) TaxID=675120 RepID=N1PEP3_DOTSN|nr:hypothetical protein DOTSEDRAFT_74811 [Dothistroma septosporum NZE10]
MKICVVTPSLPPNTEGAVQPNLAKYIDPEVHSVQTRQIRKEHAIEDIDELEIGNFDVFVNFLFSQEPFDEEWAVALQYLNTKYLVGIGSLADSALDLCAKNMQRSQAPGPPEYADSQASAAQGLLPSCSRNVQEGEYSVLVVLYGQTAFALTPLIYQSATESGREATWTPIPESDLSRRLETTAISAFEQIRGTEYLGYLSTVLRVDKKSDTITVSNIDPATRLFCPTEVSPFDLHISQTIPGGHAAFFETLLSTRLARVPHYVTRNQGCARQHDRLARLYYTILDSTNVTYNRLSPLVGKFDYDGSVLDCCSGSGEFARFAIENGVRATYSALDYSVEMTELPYSKKLYEQPFIIGPVQEVLASAPMHDHVVCFGSLHLLQPFDFVSTISQFFLRARKSVTFDVDDLSETYIKNFPDASSEKCWEKLEYNHNNVARAFRFGVPLGWRAVVNGDRRYAYRSLVMKEDVHTHSFRFEREV